MNNKCVTKGCPKQDLTYSSNCRAYFNQNMPNCPNYEPETPLEQTRELTLTISELSTKQLEEVILNAQYSLWFRREALTEHDNRCSLREPPTAGGLRV